jgi:hypothetical protein
MPYASTHLAIAELQKPQSSSPGVIKGHRGSNAEASMHNNSTRVDTSKSNDMILRRFLGTKHAQEARDRSHMTSNPTKSESSLAST